MGSMGPVQFGWARVLTQVGSWLGEGGGEVVVLLLRLAASGCSVRRGRGWLGMSTAPWVGEWESRNEKKMSVVVVGIMALPYCD